MGHVKKTFLWLRAAVAVAFAENLVEGLSCFPSQLSSE